METRYAVRLLMLGIMTFCLVACGPSRKVRVADLWEPAYRPDYSYDPGTKSAKPSGYTIGVIKTRFVQKTSKTWFYTPDEQKRVVEPFQSEVANAIEKILLTKGNKVAGPFDSYEEMTYPERERCSFLIQPTIILDLGFAQSGSLRFLDEVGGPNLESYAYGTYDATLSGTAQMEYVILDPLTREKLERHKLKTKTVSVNVKPIMQAYYNKEGNQYGWKSLSAWAKENPKMRAYYSNYHDIDNVSNRLFESMFQEFIPQIDKLISVAEFDHLKKYQEELKERKRY